MGELPSLNRGKPIQKASVSLLYPFTLGESSQSLTCASFSFPFLLCFFAGEAGAEGIAVGER